jgi:SAM-dependent methyltransferase
MITGGRTHPWAPSARSSKVGDLGISERLRSFVEEMPYERRPILRFVREVADSLPAGTVVLDIGAGDAPYRELFAHCEYRTSDWEGSVHEGARDADYVSAADSLPLDDAGVDAVLLTQVLEHVPVPAAVLQEAARVTRPGGGVFVTVPFVWELHELPHDYWRFTPAALERLLGAAGFVEIEIEARSDCFETVAQLLRNLRYAMGRAPDGRDPERDSVSDLLDRIADHLGGLGELDAAGTLPLGWTARARRA